MLCDKKEQGKHFVIKPAQCQQQNEQDPAAPEASPDKFGDLVPIVIGSGSFLLFLTC